MDGTSRLLAFEDRSRPGARRAGIGVLTLIREMQHLRFIQLRLSLVRVYAAPKSNMKWDSLIGLIMGQDPKSFNFRTAESWKILLVGRLT